VLKLNGVFTALITPFDGGEIDYDCLQALTRRQVEAGVHGLVPLGSTGEAATLTFDERARVIETVLKEASGKIPVIVGAGTNNTAETIKIVQQAKDLGADAAMSVTPYYNKPNAEGLLAHYNAIGEAVDIPLLAYNVPGRTGLNLVPEVAAEISELPFMVGLKDASANVMQVQDVISRTRGNWSVVSGEDQLMYTTLAIGGTGIICTSSNVFPEGFVALYNLFTENNTVAALDKQYELAPLIKAMFCQTNPVPVKMACSLLGLCKPELRLPLVELNKSYLPLLSNAMAKLGLL